ncbi:rhamnan synthesis F family protein [Burkholderia territorii]|uniref:rhamnan synthesis F family protein n=1 Tax=Burkholderia territorii TaxID=1503055 RepID=UPI000ACA1B47|nr:rhamnan synthesis F family protein [Burkholderia territorii]
MKDAAAERPNRCFLFAAYYPDDKVDDFDLYHLQKLAALGDVFYFVDAADFPEMELARVRPYVRFAGFEKHKEYDFGSWKRLISMVGLDELSCYDEIVIVNNSSILVGDLEPYFAAFEQSRARFGAMLLLDEHYNGPVVQLSDYLVNQDVQVASAMFPSSFWIFRREFFVRPFVQNFFETVKPEVDRLEVCYRYERGFSRSVFRHAVEYQVFIDKVFKHSSIYTMDAFELIDLGLPYIKKKLFSQFYYQIDFLDARIKRLIKNAPPAVASLLRAQFGKDRAARGAQ